MKDKIISVDPRLIVTRISDAAILNNQTAEGRMIPLIIFDVAKRPDLLEAFRVH